MIEENHWHPVAFCEYLAEQPLAVTLLGRAVVLWRDASGAAHAWADQCPHRGAKLSMGKIAGNRLECPYHGWAFAPSGQCVRIPALPSFEPLATHCAKTFQACERHGLIWVRMASSASGDAQVLPEFPVFKAEADAQLRKLNCGPYDVAASAPRIVENFLDMAHFAYVHEGWLGSRDATAIDGYLVEALPTGLRATQCKAWQPRSSVHSTAIAQVEYTYEVTAPYAAVLTKVPDPLSLSPGAATGGYRESIALFICPLGPESSRVWFRLAVADFESTDDKLRQFQHTIFLQDKPVLESQMPKRLPLDLRDELHTTADRASSVYRRHLKDLSITFGVC